MIKILIIDDSKVMRDLLYDMLTEDGYDVITTGDSKKGIQIGINEPIDICICDIHLPDKNGFDIYKEISTMKSQMNFILTDSLPDHISEKARKAGAYYHLKKPFELEQMRKIINQILKPVKTT